MITIYGRATSSNVQAVMWGLAELGLDCKRLDYGHDFGGLDSAEFAALTPHRVVPVMTDDDVVVWESCAILRYLAARYGADSNAGAAFWPAAPAARAEVDMWAEWAKVSLAPAFTVPIFWLRVRTSAEDRDEVALSCAIAAFETRLDVLERQLDGHRYLISDRFTLADVVVGHLLYRWFDMDIPRKPRANIEKYYQRLTKRHPFRDHVMISYETLRAVGA